MAAKMSSYTYTELFRAQIEYSVGDMDTMMEMRQFVNRIQWEISHNNSQKAGASKIQFFAKDTPDLNFKERADQWQQLKENKPEEIRRYQNLLDEHHHNIYKARFDAIPAGVVQSYKAKLAKEQISDEKYVRKHIVKRYCSKHGWTGTSWFNRNKYKKAMKIVQQEDEKILLKQNILLKKSIRAEQL